MITEAWEAGQAVIAALLLWIAVGAVLVGMGLAGAAMGVMRAVKGLRASLAAVHAAQALRSHPHHYKPSEALSEPHAYEETA